MHRKMLFLSLRGWLLLSGSSLILALIILFSIHPFLSLTDRAENAELLIVEGWLPEYALKQAIAEYKNHPYKQIITTGGPTSADYRVYMNSTLNFIIPDSVALIAAEKPLIVQAYGSQADRIHAHFMVWVNDSICVGEAYTKSQLKKYTFLIDTCVSVVKTVQIQFDNDRFTPLQDRDLFIRSVTVGDKEVNFKQGILLDKQYLHTRTKKIPIKSTYAESAAANLIRLGMDSAQVKAIPSPPVRMHKTYNSAAILKKYLLQTGIKSFNVMSVGAHSRRSLLTYEKALGSRYAIGIIAVENQTYNPNLWWQRKKTVKNVMREVAKYIYIRFWFETPAPDLNKQHHT